MTSDAQPAPTDFTQPPSHHHGGGQIGRGALAAAINELKSGATEIGGNNCGPWVKKYLNGLAPEGSPWCAGFVSFCFAHSGFSMPFNYTVSARSLLNQFRNKGWCYKTEDKITPELGDIIVWWRTQPDRWQGHAGIVHHFCNGTLYTIEVNRSSKVDGFIYNYKGMEKLLGLARVPDTG
jgi:hypothetical protein